MTTKIDYKFNEDKLIEEFKNYIDKTYSEHYACDGQIQSLEVIFDRGHGMGFCSGNVDKYNGRYGKKEGYNRKDLQKILHYSLLMLYLHDKNHNIIPDSIEKEKLENNWIDNPLKDLNDTEKLPDGLRENDMVDIVFLYGGKTKGKAIDIFWGNSGAGTVVQYRLSK